MHSFLVQLFLGGIVLVNAVPGVPFKPAALRDLPPSFDSHRRDQICNGSPVLCGRKYSNITFVGSHDSAFVGVLPTDNQFTSVADQLGQGVRFLQAQSHNKGGTIELCHTSCIEKDAGPLTKYLTPMKSFLDANPNEIITLLLTNGDGISVTQYDSVFQSVGLASYAYVPSGTPTLDQWPTLAELISTGKRLIVFMDYHADTSQVSYILDEFTYIYETPYDTTDPKFPQCTVDRPPGASAAGRMGLVNHFLDVKLDLFGQVILIPDTVKAGTTNSQSSITAQASLCLTANGRLPNFVLLDYISIGQATAAQNQLNGL